MSFRSAETIHTIIESRERSVHRNSLLHFLFLVSKYIFLFFFEIFHFLDSAKNSHSSVLGNVTKINSASSKTHWEDEGSSRKNAERQRVEQD